MKESGLIAAGTTESLTHPVKAYEELLPDVQDLFLKMIPIIWLYQEGPEEDRVCNTTGLHTSSSVTHPSPWQAYILKFRSGLKMSKRLGWSRVGSTGLEWIPGWKPRALTWVVRFPKYKRKQQERRRKGSGVCVCVCGLRSEVCVSEEDG